jgi:hypothetical protein
MKSSAGTPARKERVWSSTIAAPQAVAVEIGALLGQPGGRLLSVEQDEAHLPSTGGTADSAERARRLDHHRRAGRAVVGGDEAGRLDERVVVRADHDAGSAAAQRTHHVAQPGLAGEWLESPAGE